MLWNLVVVTALGAGSCAGNQWLPVNYYSSDPAQRMEQLMIDSENLRQIHDEWRRFWMNDQPAELTPYRIHSGGTIPPATNENQAVPGRIDLSFTTPRLEPIQPRRR